MNAMLYRHILIELCSMCRRRLILLQNENQAVASRRVTLAFAGLAPVTQTFSCRCPYHASIRMIRYSFYNNRESEAVLL